jgi:dTMP kinase
LRGGGKLIVFEGLDGSGKSTQVRILSEFLRGKGYNVVVTEWNSSRVISKVLKRAKRARMLDPISFSMFHAADFIARLESVIIPSLQEGDIVIADRYIYTALARDRARGARSSWIENIYYMAPIPDISIYCWVSPEEALKRVISKNRRGIPKYYEAGMDIHPELSPKKAFLLFQSEMERYYDELLRDGKLVKVDMTRSVEETANEIRELVIPIIEGKGRRWSYKTGGSSWTAKGPFTNNLEKHGLPGKIIAVEGVPGSGTTLQSSMLHDALRMSGVECQIIGLDRSWISSQAMDIAISSDILSPLTRLMISASEMAFHTYQIALPILKRGGVVIWDRYLISILAEAMARGVPRSFLRDFPHNITFKPDLMLYISMPYEKAIDRMGGGSIGWAMEGGRRYRRGFFKIMEELARREGCVVVDGDETKEEVFGRILKAVEPLIPQLGFAGGPDPALSEVIGLFQRCNPHHAHSWKVHDLALSIFDGIRDLHGLGDRERRILSYAAILHDIGYCIGASNHNEHTMEIITETDFSELDPEDKELMAVVAYMHRGRWDDWDFRYLVDLEGEAQAVAMKLASILRIADGLDCEDRQVVHGVRCYVDEKNICHVDLRSLSWATPEKARAFYKSDLFHMTYGVPLVIEWNGMERKGIQGGEA